MKELLILSFCIIATVAIAFACSETVRRQGLKHYIDIVWLGTDHRVVKGGRTK